MKTTLAVLLLAAVAVLLWRGLRWFEKTMIFIPTRAMSGHPGVVELPYEALWLTTSDGVRLRAWWIPASAAAAAGDPPVMLCLHGNGGNLSHRLDKMRIFHDAGAAQLWVDWRGYGESGGRPSEEGIYRDAMAAWGWVVARATPDRLVLYGESLGGGAAVELATRISAAGLILDGGFSSIADMSRVVLPRFPVRLLSLRFDNAAKLPRVAIPTLFLHSKSDEIIPYAQARRNFEASGAAKKTFVDLKGGHNDAFLASMPAYRDAIRLFLSSLPRVAKKA